MNDPRGYQTESVGKAETIPLRTGELHQENADRVYLARSARATGQCDDAVSTAARKLRSTRRFAERRSMIKKEAWQYGSNNLENID
jgi:hypothetical protein